MSLEQMDAVAALLRTRPLGGTLEQRREWYEDASRAMPIAPGVAFERATVGANLSGQWAIPDGAPADAAILYLHGGAFVIGSSASYRPLAAQLAAASGVRVFVPDYRRAPEALFPAAAEDCLAAFEWLEGQGFAAERIAVGGDSAGGHLAAGLIQARLAAGRPAPAAAWLVSAYLDMTHSGESIATRAELDRFIDARGIDASRFYLAGTPPEDPRASPLFGRFEGFPPTLITVGSDEVLFDDSLRLWDKLRGAGVPAVFQEWVGALHAFPMFVGLTDEGAAAVAQAAGFFRRQLLGHQTR